ncbi:hypothetical protein JQ615_12080 [Bradyrhizobium jicamae]|uniref:Uncharacterized protein n=1 Tax=Bradyrhizobium jicamae TaxID=280332 RepID=A0ABS5FH61_9BRAD|nr:hypothetical protein [Bradyrhizobium jicamae]MBR0796127.1 hypothetical protein [Bradyrhizobium jicamae]MBR0935726.1 hypothetical protein [Bradyrhizobium jicamae]
MPLMKPRQFFLAKRDDGTDAPPPDFENVVKAVISTFAVFVGFTINSYLNNTDIENFRSWRFWAFIALASLLLRYIIGSSVHLNHVYVKKIWAERPRSCSVLLLFKDVCFLVIFGMIAVHTAKAKTFNEFVDGTLWFVFAGFVWSVLDKFVRGIWKHWDTHEAPGQFVNHWILLDLALVAIVLLVNCLTGHELTRAMVVAGFYLLFLFFDFLAIVRATQFE